MSLYREFQLTDSTQEGGDVPYRGLFLLGLYFCCKAKAPKLIPLKFLLQYKSYGE